MRHPAGAETEGDLDFIAIPEKLDTVADLDLKIVVINKAHLGGDGDALHVGLALLLASLTLALALLVLELPVVHDPADRRGRGGGDLDEIHSLTAGYIQCFTRGHNPKLLSVFAYNTHFTNANAVVNTGAHVPVAVETAGITMMTYAKPPG